MDVSFEEKIIYYCEKHALFSRGDAVLVALSGGGDSVGLLHALIRLREKLGISLEAAHLNHSLRGEESEEDERFCRSLCSQFNIHLTVKKLSGGEITGKEGSIETVARKARRSFLKRTKLERGLNKIATGHTFDDQAETILQRIIRGTGPAGLRGIVPNAGGFVRPFLCVTREEIRAYLDEHGIGFREDSSNEDTVFIRNRIRHKLIPFMRDTFSVNVAVMLNRLGELSRVQETYLEEQAREAFQKCRIHADSSKILLDKLSFMGYHKVLRQRMVRHGLEMLEGAGRDTDMEEVEYILDLISGESGVCDITSEIRCEAGDKTVTFAAQVEKYNPVPLKLPGETVIPMNGGVIVAEKGRVNTQVDGEKSVFVSSGVTSKYGGLTVGLTKRGELMTPYGRKKPVKIRDIMSAVSLPRILRDSMPVIRTGGIAVWVPGISSAELLRTVGESQKMGRKGSPDSVILSLRDGLLWNSKTCAGQ